MEILSLSIDLTRYKSPVSELKVGVLGVSMSSIALVFILLILALLFSFYLFFFLVIIFSMDYLILKLPKYSHFYSICFSGFSNVNPSNGFLSICSNSWIDLSLILFISIFTDVSRFSFCRFFIYLVLCSSSFCAMKHKITNGSITWFARVNPKSILKGPASCCGCISEKSFSYS